MKDIHIYDIEVFKNQVLFGFLNIRTLEKVIYEISPRMDQSRQLFAFLKYNVKGLIGFNNLGYDSKIINFFLRTKINNTLRYYQISQNYIKSDSVDYNPLIPQIDLQRIAHFDRTKTSLKYCEFGMRMENIEDLPYPYDKVLTEDEMSKVKEYLHNDLDATYKLYKMFIPRIKLRTALSKEYGLPCMSWSDAKIGEQLVLKLYCKYTGRDPDVVSQLRTPRSSINLKDVIPDYIEFNEPELVEVFNTVKNTTIVSTKGDFELIFNYRDLEYKIATGGIHAARKGIFRSNNEWVIYDLDVGGYYPSLITENKIYPEHLGEAFYEVIDKELVQPRANIYKPGSKDPNLDAKTREDYGCFSDGLKLGGNSCFGKTASHYSFLYDPKACMSITVPGQLSLLMLAERFHLAIEDVMILGANTDGITLYLRRKDLETAKQVYKEWEDLTRLTLEGEYYDTIFQKDVNNYIWYKEGKEPKLKGAYEIEKKVGSGIALNKNSSMRIVPKAVKEYFINNVPVEETIKSCTDIFDFCIGTKLKDKTWWFSLADDLDSERVKMEQVKVFRYYVANEGNVVYKESEEGSKILLEAWPDKTKAGRGKYWGIIPFNRYFESDDYNINYEFYIRAARGLCTEIEKYGTREGDCWRDYEQSED